MLRRIAIGAAVLVTLAVSAWAVDVQIPARVRKATLVVDDLGQVIFGSTPAKVEVTNLQATQPVQVTNFPTISQVEVTNLPPATDAEEVVSFYFLFPVSTLPRVVTTVPSDRVLVITDIDGMYTCDGGCALQDSSGIRLAWTHALPHHSYTSGVPFGPGETVTLGNADGSIGGSGSGRIAFMGKLVPVR